MISTYIYAHEGVVRDINGPFLLFVFALLLLPSLPSSKFPYSLRRLFVCAMPTMRRDV